MGEVVVLEQGKLTPQQVIGEALGNVEAIQSVCLIKMDHDGVVHFSWSNMSRKDLAFMAMALNHRATTEMHSG